MTNNLKTKSPKSAQKLWTKDFILGTGINFFLMINYYSLMVVVADFSMKHYGVNPAIAGLAASIFIIGALFARFFSGGIMDTFGRKKLLTCGAICEVIFSLLYLSGFSLGLLFILRLLHGIAYGACSTTIGTIVTALVPDERKGEGVGYYMLSVTLGAAVGPFLGMFLTQNFSFTTLFIAVSVVAAATLLSALIIKAPEAENYIEAKTHPQPKQKTKKKFTLSDYLEKSVMPISGVCAILFFCYSSLMTFLTPFAEEVGLAGPASVFFVVYALAMFVTRPFTGRMFDKKGDRIVMIPAFIGFIIGMIMLAISQNAVTMFIAAALLGYGVGTVQSSGLTMAVNTAPDNRLSLANSTFYVFLDTGVGIGPLILGVLAPLWGYRGLFMAMSVVAGFALLAYLILSKHHAKKKAA